MNIILATPRGFCAGVEMAIHALETALELFGAPVYVYHEIVHNTRLVAHFRGRGVVFVDDLNEVPAEAHLLYSAHGVSPAVRELSRRRGLKTIDATCPLVTKVHLEAMRYAILGYTIVLIGHRGHDEVVGTMGEAPGMILVESPDDVDRLDMSTPKLAYLTQTTLSVDDARGIITRLKERFPTIASPATGDICYATQNRQEATRILAREADVVLVVGSPNSSNSRRLAEVAGATGADSHLIDSVGDIDMAWFRPGDTVLITAGASVPEIAVQECVHALREAFGATVESRAIREENVDFGLPRELRVPPAVSARADGRRLAPGLR
jgi:4-hydroxy-3-methylbut-2-en-1-yl diphosphate reductase